MVLDVGEQWLGGLALRQTNQGPVEGPFRFLKRLMKYQGLTAEVHSANPELGAKSGANDSGVMNLQVGDTLVCTYLDAANELGDPETIQDTLVVGTDVNVTGVVSHSGADKPNEPIVIRV